MITLALSGLTLSFLVVGFCVLCILLVLTILIQRPQGGGLSGAFGSGAGSGQTAFGAKTGDALTIFTIAMFLAYMLGAIGLNFALNTRPAPEAPDVVTPTGPVTPPPPPPPPPAGPPPPPPVPPPAGAAPPPPPGGAPVPPPPTTPAAPEVPPSTPPAHEPAPASPAPATPPANP
ncbi:MAG TPA: preprotein translocase subunit SecG [Phycisphaerales bacterium]|nr:preprotein translocase subunit SecG [Phycisphaerales bacterium]